MHKAMILTVLMSSFLMAQFSEGTISAGSLFSYSSYKESPDADPVTTATIGNTSISAITIVIKPAVSYFIRENLSIDAIVSFTKISHGDYDTSLNLYGGGATYYTGNIYAGGGLGLSAIGNYDSNSKSEWIDVHCGYLHGITENVFLDIGLSYIMGKGEYVTEYDSGEEYKRDNEDTILRIGVGIKAFFNKP